MAALITTANSPKALAVVRSLGEKGINVDTADRKKFALSSLSRYSKNFFLYPSPARYPQEFINRVYDILNKHSYDALIPVHSEDTYLIAKHKSSLERFTNIPLHDYSVIKQINDKGYLIEVAEMLDIPVPHTYQVRDIAELKNIADIVTYPAVIKLRDSSSSIGVSYVHSREELISQFKNTVYKYNLSHLCYPLIQEYISGVGCGVSLLFNEGDLRARFSHKRLREYPISGGPATYRISIKHQKMEKLATRLLEHFKWHGVAMVEFKLDQKQNPILMEVNPRFWGSINQAIRSGVDFPFLLYQMTVEGDIDPVLDYKIGVKTKNIFIDYVALYNYFIKTKKIKYLREYLSMIKNDDIITFSDPLPILGMIREGIREIINSRYG